MQQAFNQLLQFLQTGISAIFKLVGTIWSWILGEVTRMVSLPWAQLPTWKLIVLGICAVAASYFLYKAARELWDAFEKTLRAFAGLLASLVTALPWGVGGGAILFAGLWIAKTF